jgi:prophage antirepressor-like protein
MNELQIFKNEEFGEIRSLEINNEPYFVGNEIANILGYKNTRDAISKHVEEEDKISDVAFYDGSQNRKMTVINESGLYSLIMSSKLPNAKRFKRWVTSEVLPSIRKTGGYISGEENMNEDELILKAMNVLNAKVENLRNENRNLLAENDKKDQLIGELKPKADYTDRILQCDDLTKVNVIACDYGFTAPEFNKMLKKFSIQYKEGTSWLLYKKYRGKGYTQTKTFEFTHSNGTQGSRTSMMWTQKGRLFLYEFLKAKGILPRMEEEQISIY